VFDVLSRLRDAGITVVILEHKVELLHEHADRVHVIAGGRVAASGTPREILADPRMAEWGVGSTRYTQAGRRALEQGLLPAGTPLPVSFDEAAAVFAGGAR